jgi:predicted amidophosphoribosyltransferase
MNVVSLKVEYQTVLIIDDAVGSGATINEIAQKLKARGAKKVIGFAIVGSYKGFEVIKEV